MEQLDHTPYGRALALAVARTLRLGLRLHHEHRDFCGMGLLFSRGRYYCLYVLDGGMTAPDPGFRFRPNQDERCFKSRASFVDWLSAQSDASLSGSELADPYYRNNQRLSRARLLQFVADAGPRP